MALKDTVFLPKTSLPIKAKPENELSAVQALAGQYAQHKAVPFRGTPWKLMDGPPYANGNIHIGHALNKTIKDITARGHFLLGDDVDFTPGWDCHGLPIEWKVEEEWRKAKRDKNAEPAAFRADCRAFAAKWVDAQQSQFKRLGIMADWAAPYLTMNPETESTILSAFHQMVADGSVYRANKPVLWSPIERTALAEAEVTEQEHTVPNLWLRFVPLSGPLNDDGASLLVWTTTPWSLPGNVAVAYNPNINYAVYEMPRGGRYVVATSLAEQVLGRDRRWLRDTTPDDFLMRDHETGRAYYNPLGEGFAPGKIIPADFVRDNSGTGFVHVGPAHSTEDWIAWRNYAGPEASFPNPVAENGTYTSDTPVFAGVSVTKGKKFGPANELIYEHLEKQGAVFRVEDRALTMQHSWRSDAVLITRAAPQVFIDLDGVREEAITALDSVTFTPEHAKTRMSTMLKSRPDWLVSRQRLWGTPLGLFVNKSTGQLCTDPVVLAKTQKLLSENGTEHWYSVSPADVFDTPEEWDRIDDVLDVWFDSGCVPLLGDNEADLVIEGTDQTRGWFSATLLVSLLLKRPLPYREVLMHGFTLDQSGKKMSKSQGNVLDPLAVVDRFGADVLRAWVASTNVTDDIRVSMTTMDGFAEVVRKIRNTMRYVVGALNGWERTEISSIPPLETYGYHRIAQINDSLREMLEQRRFTTYMSEIVNFCTNDLSAFIFDVRKDVLYCDGDTNTRRAYLAFLDHLYGYLVRWLTPILPFTVDEVRAARPDNLGTLQWWPSPVVKPAHPEQWDKLIALRSRIMSRIEDARSANLIKSSGDVHLTVSVNDQDLWDMLTKDVSLAEIAIVGAADLTFSPVEEIVVEASTTVKCDRCWLTKHDVHDCGEHHLCDRCCEIVDA